MAEVPRVRKAFAGTGPVALRGLKTAWPKACTFITFSNKDSSVSEAEKTIFILERNRRASDLKAKHSYPRRDKKHLPPIPGTRRNEHPVRSVDSSAEGVSEVADDVP